MMICCCMPFGTLSERSVVCCETVLTSPFVFVAILSSSPRSSRFRQLSQGPAARYLACRYDRYARSRIRAPPAAQGGAAVACCPSESLRVGRANRNASRGSSCAPQLGRRLPGEHRTPLRGAVCTTSQSIATLGLRAGRLGSTSSLHTFPRTAANPIPARLAARFARVLVRASCLYHFKGRFR